MGEVHQNEVCPTEFGPFRVGNVVRGVTDGQIGVISAISRYNIDVDPTLYELMVTSADGTSIWPPDATVNAPDEESRAEAIRLGLIALNPHVDIATFRVGSIVRDANGYGQVGVIRAIQRLRVQGPPAYHLIVNTAAGRRDWSPGTTVKASDEESRAEAIRLGLLPG
jgi:hypothetical protein